MPVNRRAPRINMTEMVYNIIQKNPKKGFAPFEILEQPEADGITARSFPYLQLYKLKKGGEIIEKDGRYYPVEEVQSVISAETNKPTIQTPESLEQGIADAIANGATINSRASN